VLAAGPEGCSTPALLEGRRAIDGRPAAFVCRDFACRAPVSGPRELAVDLAGIESG